MGWGKDNRTENRSTRDNLGQPFRGVKLAQVYPHPSMATDEPPVLGVSPQFENN